MITEGEITFEVITTVEDGFRVRYILSTIRWPRLNVSTGENATPGLCPPRGNFSTPPR